MGSIAGMRDDGDMTDTTRSRTDRSTRLERSREDRILAGVSGGLGIHLGINPWWFRFAFLILTFFGGFGLLVYIAAWLVIPDQGYKDPIISQWLGRLDTNDGGTIFGLILVGAAAVIILTQFANVSGTLVVAAILFIVGLLLYRGDLTPKRPTPGDGADAPRTGDHEGGDLVDDHPAEDVADDASAVVSSAVATRPAEPMSYEPEAPVAPIPPPPPRRPREHSMLGRFTIAIGLIALAVMALVDVAFDRVEIAPVYYVATAVGVAGLGLLVGAWIGRARWLIIVAVVLLPALWFTSLWPTNFSFTAGEVTERPIAVSEVTSPYELGFGQFTIDLSGMTASELAEVGSIEVSLGMGEMILRLPSDVGVLIDAEVGMGAVQGPFTEAAGVGVEATRIVGSEPVVFEIKAEVGAGVVTVRQAGLFERSNG